MNTDDFSKRRAAALLLAALLACVTWPAAAQTAQLAPQAARISDEVIQADLRAYEALQARIKALNERGRPLRDYFLAKAQCWLDVSHHEYTRNDRSEFPQAALTESEGLVRALEGGVTPSRDTPLVNGATRLRADLWARTAAMQGQAGMSCAQHKVACAEVELVHAGNEDRQLGWRHAKPYVQIAEDLVSEAADLAQRCAPPAAQTPPPPPPPPTAQPSLPPPSPAQPVVIPAPPAQAAVPQVVQLVVGVLFDFDKHDAAHMRSFSRVQLEEAIRQLQRERLVLQGIRLNGHADRLNGTRQADYNLRLSEKRVATVKAELLRLGVAPQLIVGQASGDQQPIPGCEQRFGSPAQLQECLLPNRRVEVLIEARRP